MDNVQERRGSWGKTIERTSTPIVIILFRNWAAADII